MSYSVRKLITKSWYLSGIVGRSLNTVSGEQINDGLDLLNELLAFKTANNRLIPYFKPYQFNAIIGHESYFIPNLISIETITFNLQTVRFPMSNQSRKPYFGSGRVDGITSLPYSWHLEREKGGAVLYMYFLPQDTYPIKIVGKFSLAQVVLTEDLSATLDLFYISYLRYALAGYMCEDYGLSTPPETQMKLNEYEAIITDISPIDLSTQKLSTLQNGPNMNWAYVNFPGWSP